VVNHGVSTLYIAKRYGISRRWVQAIAKEYREKGKVSPPKRRGRLKHRNYTRHIDTLNLRIHRKYKTGAVGIGKILCTRYSNYLRSNGKIERFFQTYEKHRHEFKSKDEFLHWYNCVRPHMSLNFDELETPEHAFYRKAQVIILENFWKLAESDRGHVS